jgi:uncharacterized protein (TIGR03435 family)
MKFANKLSFGGEIFTGVRKVLIVCAVVVFGLACATPSSAKGQQQQALDAAMVARSTSSSTPARTTTYEYEVVSIKPSKTASGNGFFRMGMRYTDDGLSAENCPLMFLFQNAYGVNRDRISGAPDWLNSELYDIEAKMDGATAEELKRLSPDEIRTTRQHMLQTLLADRFKLALHRETKELPVYDLVIARGGPKLQEAKPDDKAGKGDKTAWSSGGPLAIGGGPAGSKGISAAAGGGATVSFGGRGGNRSMSGKAVTMDGLTATLANLTGRPVLDKTGLTGKYDYKLEYAPQDNSVEADPTGPSIFTAVQEQLGLKLESGKGPVDVIVIDHVERPSGN